MPFSTLSDAQRAFLAAHTKSGKALAHATSKAPENPHEAEQIAWMAKVSALKDQIKAAPAALDTSKLQAALDKSERVFRDRFDPNQAEKALATIQAAFVKASGHIAENTEDGKAKLAELRTAYSALSKLAFPDKKSVSAKIEDQLSQAETQMAAGEFSAADRLMGQAETAMASARVGVDAKAAKDLKPADLNVLMKTHEGQAQLDAIVDNLTDDVPPNVMASILEARFSLDHRLFQSTYDRENSMLDKAKHGAMLETDSPKLRKLYKQLMDKQAADKSELK